jgi:hypothetical protein
MSNLYLIFASQEYESSNHKNLWLSMSEHKKNDCFVVVNIPADQIISRIKRKKIRIIESKQAPKRIGTNFYLFRPSFFIRPEVVPNIFYKSVCKSFIRQLSTHFNFNNFSNVFCLVYNALWIKVLSHMKNSIVIGYYLFDEVRLNADSNKPNKKRTKLDKFACLHSDIIFAISNGVANNRKEFSKKITVVGNGSSVSKAKRTQINISKSVAFIGNFRAWIDKKLLCDLVKIKSDYDFHIIGPVEKNMRPFLNKLKEDNKNVFYEGIKSKEEINDEYSKYLCILIPYIQNDFIHCTRPIKIVESVFQKTPVITVPVSGYDECDFIKFATTADEFADIIDSYYMYFPDFNSKTYKEFISKNSWDSIATTIIDCFNERKPISKESECK